MNDVTQCPTCNTRFKVTQEQLDAHHGMVRCGRCQAVFNAIAQLHEEQPNPQLDLPITADEIPPSLPEPTAEAAAESVFTSDEELDFSYTDASAVATEAAAETEAEQISPDHPSDAGLAEARHVGLQPDLQPADLVGGEPLTQAHKITFAHIEDETPPAPVKKKPVWPWAVGSALLLILLLAQAAYFFRIDLAARLPGLRPALTAYCGLLGCSVPLPQKADLMSIESSDLEIADPAQANVITLNAILRNRAPFSQAYPNLELTLTDTEEKAVARRTFRPAEYLRPGEDEKQGLAANRELNVKLNLDTTDLMASGYRLFLFYPQH